MQFAIAITKYSKDYTLLITGD